MSLETPLRKVRGLGSARSGASHFAYQRVSAIVLVPLSLWFAISALGLTGVSDVSALSFLQMPMHAVLMGIFLAVLLYHLALGLQEVIVDYIQSGAIKLFLILAVYGFAAIAAAIGILSLIRA